MSAPLPENEAVRLEALRRYHILDTKAEQTFDDITKLASYICKTPVAIMTLVDSNRQWFKAKVGVDISETPRDHAFCSHTILDKGLLVVEDTLSDTRFATNPLVTQAPHIRFYAGAPLCTEDGFALGSICVIDVVPRKPDAGQKSSLEALARLIVSQLEMRRVSADLVKAADNLHVLRGLLPICSFCKNVRNDKGYWETVDAYLNTHSDATISHGICPDCAKSKFPELKWSR